MKLGRDSLGYRVGTCLKQTSTYVRSADVHAYNNQPVRNHPPVQRPRPSDHAPQLSARGGQRTREQTGRARSGREAEATRMRAFPAAPPTPAPHGAPQASGRAP